jgi:hypothetical protein
MNKETIQKTIGITLASLFVVAMAYQFLGGIFIVLIISAVIITLILYNEDALRSFINKSDKPRAQHRIYKFSKEDILNKLKLNPSKVSATKWNSDKQELIVQEDLE